MARQSRGNVNKTTAVGDYEHILAKRTNNPPAGLAHLDRDETPVRQLVYDPHLDPHLVWAGKAERDAVDVPAPSIHVHEELSAEKIIGSVRRQRIQQPLFAIEALDPAKQVEFYQHDLNWSNRMILGDSLMVMASLLDRERMAGHVQCVYMDPPYGIKYQSNFQPRISDRAVKDGDDNSLTREPEMIQAYRDTWRLGVHSYLAYLRDRFILARELLNNAGSIFVQISDENLHRVRLLLDEVFGGENFISLISYVTTSGFAQAREIARSGDYLLWYARDKASMKVRTLWLEGGERAAYRWVELPDGARRGMTTKEIRGEAPLPLGARMYTPGDLTSQGSASKPQPFKYQGRVYNPPANSHWKANYPDGMERLATAGRIHVARNSIRYVRYADDFAYRPLTNLWTDTGTGNFTDPKTYVVQTNTKIVERCLAMTSDPGDLVLDPTCGSGTTAYVAENLGRRWITVDTSRVALALARERILTAVFPYYRLLDPTRGVDGGLVYETTTRITLGSIANDEPAEGVVFVDRPLVQPKKTRVTGPFTVEALSRYAVNPNDEEISSPDPSTADAADHVQVLLDALHTQGIPRPGGQPAKIESLMPLATAGPLQAEGIADLGGQRRRFAVALGPKFGAITMTQVSDALREAIGFDLVVFAGFAVSTDAQERLAGGKFGGTQVSLLLANPDLLVGDLLKNTKTSQTFRLYSAPDVHIDHDKDGFRVTVEGVDTFDPATGEVVSYGKSGVQAWFLDDDYDGTVFHVAQAFFPVTEAWKKLQSALRGTVDADLLDEMHGWTSLPFEPGEHDKVAVRVISQDGNAAEVIVPLPGVSA
ncbi:site-specific DNA-methyltransferase [Microtetraspora malaysiensis]|uniref:Site-specific DNA-methyltransferase n=1 Tax=Microtetraspora malaysiensis TaxID=161358 RepID=A0ABW6SQH4_9ACTN